MFFINRMLADKFEKVPFFSGAFFRCKLFYQIIEIGAEQFGKIIVYSIDEVCCPLGFFARMV